MNSDKAISLYHDLIQALGYATGLVPLVVTNNHTAQIILGVAGFAVWGFGTYLSLKFNTPEPTLPTNLPKP